MAYVWQRWLADACRGEGLHVIEEGDWEHRGRPSSTGAFDPYAVLWHHTGTTASSSNPHPSRSVVINGRADLPGPLCHLLVCYLGEVHVIAAGRANHAGQNRGSGPIKAGDGNAQMLGIEIDYDGTQDMPPAAYASAVAATAALLKRL